MKTGTPLALLFALCWESHLFAQTDSLRAKRLYFIHADIGSMTYYASSGMTAQDFVPVVKTDPLLLQDFGDYEKHDSYGGGAAPLFGLRFGLEVPGPKKGARELSVGLRVGRSYMGSVMYWSDTLTIVDTFVSPATNSVMIQYREKGSYYQFSINATSIFVPVSYCITSNRKKWLRLSAGLECAPGVLLAPSFRSDHQEVEADIIAAAEVPRDQLYQYRSYNGNQFFSESKTTRLKGAGFAAYASLPLSVNIGPRRPDRLLGRIQVFATAAPFISFTSYRHTRNTVGYWMSFFLGLGYVFPR
jgi:hypothetical protein